MDPTTELIRWLAREGRFLAGNRELFPQFCARLREARLPLDRSWLHIRALHPEYAGVSRLWTPDGMTERYLEHGYERRDIYLRSTIRYVVEGGITGHWRLEGDAALPYPLLDELRAQGFTDYIVAPLLYSDGTANAISWATRRPGGFTAAESTLLDEVLPSFSAIVEIKSLRRFATNMLTTYVGREPGALILKGQIRRGDVRTITAALMLVDLRDFTGISDALAPAAVIEMLNRYFDCIIPPVVARGGEIMEIMGDGILAIFADSAEAACRQAFAAANEGLRALAATNTERRPGAPVLAAGLALHYGTVSYGNIGSGIRLDFTVIGPDVNLTSRIERLCRELDRPLIMSEAFAARLPEPMFEIGHFRLRGFTRMQLLFGLPEPAGAETAASQARST